jgi:predicted enzyme related to lactoylglutathione lyase
MSMPIQNVLAGVAVRDLKAAIPWYSQLLEREADSLPMPEVAEWKFDRGGWLQVFHDEERAGASSLTLSVDDLDATLAALQRNGVTVGKKTNSKSVRTAILNDPDGNRIVLAQALSGALAQ